MSDNIKTTNGEVEKAPITFMGTMRDFTDLVRMGHIEGPYKKTRKGFKKARARRRRLLMKEANNIALKFILYFLVGLFLGAGIGIIFLNR